MYALIHFWVVIVKRERIEDAKNNNSDSDNDEDRCVGGGSGCGSGGSSGGGGGGGGGGGDYDNTETDDDGDDKFGIDNANDVVHKAVMIRKGSKGCNTGMTECL